MATVRGIYIIKVIQIIGPFFLESGVAQADGRSDDEDIDNDNEGIDNYRLRRGCPTYDREGIDNDHKGIDYDHNECIRNFDGWVSVVYTLDREGVFGILTVRFRSFAH